MGGYTKRNCDNCNKEYYADNRNLKRGWGLCCSKSCAAKKREKSRPDYNPETVRINNLKRRGKLPRHMDINCPEYWEDNNSLEEYENSPSADDDQWGDHFEHGVKDF